MKPFVLVASRGEEEPAQAEYEAFRDIMGLNDEQLIRIRLEREAMPAISPDDISGVIVSGSPYTTSDPVETKSAEQLRVEQDIFDLIDMVMKHDIPFFGACYGVGSLGVHQGAIIDRTHGEEVSVVEISLTDDGLEDPLVQRSGVPQQFLAAVGHKEAVSQLPAQAVLLATGEACPVQMFRIGTKQYATQFHPELDTPSLIARAGFYKTAGYFDPDDYDDLCASLENVDSATSKPLLRAFRDMFAKD